jgi:hypothetical protein
MEFGSREMIQYDRDKINLPKNLVMRITERDCR